jgi:hypothetical protein
MSIWFGIALLFLGATLGFFTAALLTINRIKSDYEDPDAKDRSPEA